MITFTKELNCNLENKNTLQKQIETINLFLNYQKNCLTTAPSDTTTIQTSINSNKQIIDLINNFYNN